MSDVTFNIAENKMQIHQNNLEPWHVTLVDTGENTMTGGRLKRVAKYLDAEDFCLTYGDGLADINLNALIAHHKKNNTLATLTTVRPSGRFGAVAIKDHHVVNFIEKPEGYNEWVNGGFFVLSPEVLKYIHDDNTAWEKFPLEQLTREGQLSAYQHSGFWHAMDTLRDKNYLEELWQAEKAPWKVWSPDVTSYTEPFVLA